MTKNRKISVFEIGLNKFGDRFLPNNISIGPNSDVILIDFWVAEDFDFTRKATVIQTIVFDVNDCPGFGFEVFVIRKTIIVDVFFGMFYFVEVVVISGDTSVDANILSHSFIITFL